MQRVDLPAIMRSMQADLEGEMGQTSPDPVSRLPTELLTLITASFSLTDIASTLKVSSAWRAAFSRTVCSIRPHGPLPATTKLSRPFPKLQELYLERCEGAAYTDEHVKDVAQLPDLQHLSLEGFRNCTDDGVAAIACLTGEAKLPPLTGSVAFGIMQTKWTIVLQKPPISPDSLYAHDSLQLF